VASFSPFGNVAALGVASIELTGLARLITGVVSAASATPKLNVAAQHNSKRELGMNVMVKNRTVYLAEARNFATSQQCLLFAVAAAPKTDDRVTFAPPLCRRKSLDKQ